MAKLAHLPQLVMQFVIWKKYSNVNSNIYKSNSMLDCDTENETMRRFPSLT